MNCLKKERISIYRKMIQKKMTLILGILLVAAAVFSENVQAQQDGEIITSEFAGSRTSTLSETVLYSSPDSESQVVSTIPAGQAVYLTQTITAKDGSSWYHIMYDINEYCYEGYVSAEALGRSFELYQASTTFPESYQVLIDQLKASHPNWNFVAIPVSDTFSYAVSSQMVQGGALVTMSYNQGLRSLAERNYNWQTNEWTQWEPNWTEASEEAIRWSMDPRNFINEDDVFMFEALTYEEVYQTESAVAAVLSGTFMDTTVPGETYTYAWLFHWIGEQYNINPIALASRARQEQGAGTSPLISGTYAGYTGLYNYFNIQATGTTADQIISNGLKEAQTGSTFVMPDGTVSSGSWDTHAKAIIGGSLKFAQLYINQNQNTLYAQKYDYDGEYNGKYWHQYMTNIHAPYSEGRTVKRAYVNMGLINSAFTFYIPVYTEMPESSPKPADIKNFNNNIKSILINNEEVIQEFDKDETEFEINVGEQTSIAIEVTPSANTSTAEYPDSLELTEGETSISIFVTAEDGNTREYTLKIICEGISGKDGLWMADDGQWYYYTNGIIDTEYTGLTYYSGGWYYIENGALDWTYTGLVYHSGSWYYVEEGFLNWNHTGLIYHSGSWYYVENGVLNWSYTGLVYHYGSWYYVENGVLNWSYTGLVYHYGSWYYVESGNLNWNYTGLVEYSGNRYYVESGILNWDRTGMWIVSESEWCYIYYGMVNTSYNGLTEYAGSWWCISGGRVAFEYSGLWYDENVGWWYVENGKINFIYNGLVLYADSWWCVSGGRVAFEYTGLWSDPYVGMWYIENGVINFNYTGDVMSADTLYHVENGYATLAN